MYGLGGIISKIVPFIMLPIVTRLMPDSTYFGLNDLFSTVVSFASTFAILGMYDAMFRMFFEKEDNLSYKRAICSTALFSVLAFSTVVALMLLVFKDFFLMVFFGDSDYASLVFLASASVLMSGCRSILAAPTRMQNRRAVFIVLNCATSVLSYAVSIPLLLSGYYVIALPFAALASNIISCIVFLVLNRNWFDIHLFSTTSLKEMLLIGLPLMPNFLFYWIFSSADRLMIANFLGVGSEGMYAAAMKIGQISQLIYTAFAQGWQYFAFSTMHDDDQVELTSSIFEYLGIVSFLATAALMVILKPFFNFMFPAEYAPGTVCVPYLFLSPLLLMLFQTGGNQFLVIKKTWPSFVALIVGVAANLALNFILIPTLGIEGAAVATLAGYLVSILVEYPLLRRLKLLFVRPRFIAAASLFCALFLLWRFAFINNFPVLALSFFSLSAVFAFLYRKDLFKVSKRLQHKNK